MRKIGLTGGIASGKSTVHQWFADRKVPIIDADAVARQVVEPGSPCLAAIKKRFGDKVIGRDGGLNREALGAIIFKNAGDRADLEGLILPAIRKEIDRQAKEYESKGCDTVIYDVPLLIEKGMYKNMDEVWLVAVDPEVQIKRLMERNQYTRDEALQRIDSQMPLRDKLPYATVVINNNGNLGDLYERLDDLWKERM